MKAVTKGYDPIIPKKHDVDLASQSCKELAKLFPTKELDFKMRVMVGNKEGTITFPFSAIQLLLQILTQMADGNAVTLIPVHAELSTQEAADLLNVSRPYLIKLLKSGKIPFRMVGTHRRLLFKDLLSFKVQQQKISQAALDELSKQAQDLQLGY